MHRHNKVHTADDTNKVNTTRNINTFLTKRSKNETETSRIKKVIIWIASGFCGMIMCSCCCNCCGAYTTSFMTKEDEEDYKMMCPNNKCQVNCLDGCTNTLAACCCCGCCCGACGTFSTGEVTEVLSQFGG